MPTVTADNARVEDCEAGTGFSNIVGGAAGAAETPYAYQGSNLFNRKVTSTTGAGFFYDPVADSKSATDMTATNRRTWMVKVMVSDYGGLSLTSAVRIRIGSDGSNYDVYVLAGTDSPVLVMKSYRAVGGLLVFPVDANEGTAYRDSGKSVGTPTLTAVDYFGAVFAFVTSTAKNENCGLDAIDVGSGLYLVGTAGSYADFVTHDEGTAATGTFDIYLDGGDATGELASDATGYDTVELAKLQYIGNLTWQASGADDEVMRSAVINI